MAIKLFCAGSTERLEDEVNAWLVNSDYKTIDKIQMTETETGWSILILYTV